jgi:hypothetical protein
MKKFTLVILILIGMAACVSNTKITGSWKNDKQIKKPYKVIFVAAMTRNSIMRSAFEGDVSAELNKENVKTLKSIDEFPPQYGKDSVSKVALMNAVKKDGSEAILTITVLKKATESRYVGGGYSPEARYSYYGNFWGYYNYWYPYTYSDGYYVDTDVYYIESNLYDSQTQLLVWSAQTKAYSYQGIAGFSKEFATIIVDKLEADGVVSSK